MGKAHRVARAIRAGTVWVNCYNVFDVTAPFGGYKESGYGRELGRYGRELGRYGRELGRYALELYTQAKTVWMRL